MIRRLLFFAALALVTATPLLAQDDDIDAQIKKAMENPNKPAPKNPNMKQMEKEAMADIAKAEAEEKAEDAKQKAAAQALVDVKGPVTLPEWTPQVPQFSPSGPPACKLVWAVPESILTGRSPLPPATVAYAWDKFSNPK